MAQTIGFWIIACENGWFVRLSICCTQKEITENTYYIRVSVIFFVHFVGDVRG